MENSYFITWFYTINIHILIFQPKTKHQRPYGWETNDFTLQPPPAPPGYRYGSLPYQHGIYPITSPTRVPPRTVPTAIERHREVKR